MTGPDDPMAGDKMPDVHPPQLPSMSMVPRESATMTRDMGAQILRDVTAWADREPGDVDEALSVRRRLAVLVELFERRALSASGVLDAQQALRLAERTAGIVTEMHGGDVDTTSDVAARCAALTALSRPEFAALLTLGRAAGSLSADAVDALLAGHVPAPVEVPAPREPNPTMGLLTTEEAGAGLAQLLDVLGAAQGGIELLTSAGVSTLDPEQAADAARILWDRLVPLVGLRNALDAHARGLRR